jgi:ATP-dependent Clp protease adaptor protein ClpS
LIARFSARVREFPASAPVRDDGTVTSASAPTVERVERPADDDVVEPERPWVTIVWNDPVNLMSYVTYVFQKLFGYSKDKATRLMLDVHEKGRAAVTTGSREQMEHDVARLHAAGLWATLQQD